LPDTLAPVPTSTTFSPPSPHDLTVRAVLTGSVLGAALSLCNIYSGLKIGWGFNMSITAALIGWGLWAPAALVPKVGALRKLETNLVQTAASAGASISSAGLVSAIPAMTLLTGQKLSYVELAVWTGVIGLLGAFAGVGLRRQLIEVDRLPFASGVAAAETLDKMYAVGSDAARKVWALLAGGLVAGVLKAVVVLKKVPNATMPVVLSVGAKKATLANLTVSLEPSPLMVAVGAISSPRTGFTMVVGSLFAWLVLGPFAVTQGWAAPGPDHPTKPWFSSMVQWLLWPGVAMMVTSSLTSVVFSWRSVLRTFTSGRAGGSALGLQASASGDGGPQAGQDVPRPVFWGVFAVLVVAATVGQMALFGITWWAAVIGALLSLALAAVAGRVSGETTITPVGAMGKVTQFVFAVLQPGSATANLMAANVTGGAASQAADMLHDLKTGAILGASPRSQAIAQSMGVVFGAAAGSAAYLLLLPNPATQVLTEAWPAPAVATWKAVAELFANGIGAMPPGSLPALVIGGAVGVVLAVLEKVLPKRVAGWMPSPASLGLSFTLQAYTSIAIFLGTLTGMSLRRFAPGFSDRFLVAIASGVIAGESLAGVGLAIHQILGGGGGH
jgi:putative OPT family oligopeptide transporter